MTVEGNIIQLQVAKKASTNSAKMTKFRRLVNLFDTHSATPFFSIKSTGLFGFEDLIQPSDFNQATTKTIIRSELIIKNISNIKTVKKLDRLSDLLCTTVDTAEFIRNVHPDPQFRIQANNTHEHLSTFLSQLNTHQGLYNVSIRYAYTLIT